MSTLGPPDMPGSLVDMNAMATISTPDYGSLSGSGMPIRSEGSSEPNIPCQIYPTSPGEALKYGHVVDESVWRLLIAVRAPDGTDIRLHNDQYITINSVQYQVLGNGRYEGASGMQTAILKLADKG